MRTNIIIERRDSSGHRMKPLPLSEQLMLEEVVSLFLAADLKTKEEILIKLRK